MTRKHYIAVAAILNEQYTNGVAGQVFRLVP